MSNTDKLQEIKKTISIVFDDKQVDDELWMEHESKLHDNDVNWIIWLISQLEQAQVDNNRLLQSAEQAKQLLIQQSIKIQILEKENERLNDEVSQVRDSNRRLCNWNEQLKADKQKLIEALKCIREDSKEDGIHYKLDRCYATAYHTLREIGEVKGNG